MKRRAFTLIELLVTIGIVAVLSAILFPVLSSAREAARRSQCASNFHQVALSSELYSQDYDDNFTLADYGAGSGAAPTNDRTWVQLVLPYTRSFSVFFCPNTSKKEAEAAITFDQDLIPGDTYSRYYRASQLSNLGYNYLYLAPVLQVGPGKEMAVARSRSQVGNASSTVLFVDSARLDEQTGRPTLGGNYLVVPPCRYQQSAGFRIDTVAEGFGEVEILSPDDKWRRSFTGELVEFGSTWNWHGSMTMVVYVDGRVKPMRMDGLMTGCVLNPNDSFGTILDANTYVWDLR